MVDQIDPYRHVLQAKSSIKEYTTETLPEQYQLCLCALDTILRNTFVMMQKAEDNREKLQAMELFKDTHLVKLELLSNATTIDIALNYIRNKQEHQGQHKKLASDLTVDDDNNNGKEQLTRGRQTIF